MTRALVVWAVCIAGPWLLLAGLAAVAWYFPYHVLALAATCSALYLVQRRLSQS